jgi:predicted lipoprotein
VPTLKDMDREVVMSTNVSVAAPGPGPGPARKSLQRLVLAGVAAVVVAAMALDTKVVRIGSEEDVSENVFSPETFGAAEFPKVKASIEQRAVDSKTLAAAIAADKAAAAKQYGVPAGVGAVIPVSFTGVVGDGKSGVYNVAVDGLPPETKVRVQTGPAINGTDLRDATGEIRFGQFKNQIEFQNAGAGINNAMKQQVLAGIDNKALTGKTVSVVGAFTLVNPKNWLVTPVRLEVR